MATGLLIIRFVIGLVLVVHGLQWLFGWFGGAGFKIATRVFTAWGLRPAPLMVLTSSIIEVLAGCALVLGFLTPLAALGAMCTMLVAGLTLHRCAGQLWNTKGGGEFPYIIAAMCFGIGLIGAGQFSIDQLQAHRGGIWAWIATPPSWYVLVMLAVTFVAVLPFWGLLARGGAASSTAAAPLPTTPPAPDVDPPGC